MDSDVAGSASPPAPRGLGGRERPRRWGLGDAAAGMAVGVVLSSTAASIWLGATGSEELGLGGKELGQLALWVGLVGCVLWASRRKGSGSLAEDFGWRIRPVDLAIGVAVAVAAQLFLAQVVARLLEPLVGDPEVASRPVQELVDSAGGARFVGLLLFVAVGAPIVEELFFRGLLLRSLQRRVRNDTLAVVLSGALFAAPHIQALPGGALVLVLLSLFLLGIALAALAARTGRLGPGIVAHSAFNAISLVTVLLK